MRMGCSDWLFFIQVLNLRVRYTRTPPPVGHSWPLLAMVNAYGSHEGQARMDAGYEDANFDCGGYPDTHDARVGSPQARSKVPFTSVARLGIAGMALAGVAVGVALTAGRRHAAALGASQLAAPPPTSGDGTGGDEEISESLVVPTDGQSYDGAYLFKKTFASKDARKDAEWIVDALGFMTVSLVCARLVPSPPMSPITTHRSWFTFLTSLSIPPSLTLLTFSSLIPGHQHHDLMQSWHAWFRPRGDPLCRARGCDRRAHS